MRKRIEPCEGMMEFEFLFLEILSPMWRCRKIFFFKILMLNFWMPPHGRATRRKRIKECMGIRRYEFFAVSRKQKRDEK